MVEEGKGKKIDINTASDEQLKLILGIGEAIPKKISTLRSTDGKSLSMAELVHKTKIPRETWVTMVVNDEITMNVDDDDMIPVKTLPPQ